MTFNQSRWKFTWLVMTTCLLAAGLVPGYAAPPPQTNAAASKGGVAPAFDRDARLDTEVSINVVGVSLDDLLRKNSKEGLALSASSDYTTQKVQVRVKQRPLRSLMRALSQLLAGVWKAKKDGSGYQLTMTQEARSRRDRWWKLMQAEWENSRSAQQAYVMEKMRSEPYRRKPDDPNTENSDPGLEEQDAQHHEFFGGLPAALQDRIAGQMSNTALFTGEFNGGCPEGAVTVPLTSLPYEAQQHLQSACTQFFQLKKVQPENVTVRFNNIGIAVMTSLVLPDGTDTDTPVNLMVHQSPNARILSLKNPRLVDAVKKLGEAAPDSWKELAAYQRSRVWPNDPPASQPVRNALPPRRAEVLQWLGKKADVEFVADYYSGPCRVLQSAEKERPMPRPLKAELDALAAEQDLSWKKNTDGVHLVRNNRWYRDDYTEVASSQLQRWLPQLVALKPATKQKAAIPIISLERVRAQMDWDADVAANLTPWQIAIGLTWAAVEENLPFETTGTLVSPDAVITIIKEKGRVISFPFSAASGRVMRDLNMARFYASLDAIQRTALLEHRLSVMDLAPAQQEQVAWILSGVRELAAQRPVLLGLRAQPIVDSNSPMVNSRSIETGFTVELEVVPER